MDCPPTEEGAADILSATGVARLPSRGADGTMRTREEGTPALRLESDAGLAFGAQALLDTAPRVAVPSVWLQLATLRLALPPELENRSAAALHLVRPSLRPDQLFPQGSAVPPPDLFGTVAYRTRMAPPVWQVRVHSGYRDFGLCLEERGGCAPNASRWADFVDRTRGAEGLDLYYAVNEFVNTSVRFQADSTLEDVLDDWVTPVSLISSGEGDCEDFALAKFWLLETLGVDKSNLYIVVVQDLAVRLPHAFLAVRHGDEVWLLDSRVNRPLSPDEVDDIVPVITIGDSAAYLHGRPTQPVEATPMSWLLRWLPFS
jgi:predicted transglutaminase-like cysteine proteinase